MQVEVDVKCMQTNFGGRGLSGFGVMASFCLPSKMAKISLRTMDYSPWSSKNLIDWNWLKKFMQVGIDVSHACTPILVGVVSPVSELWLLFACLQKRPKFSFGPWTIVTLYTLYCTCYYSYSIKLSGLTGLCMAPLPYRYVCSTHTAISSHHMTLYGFIGAVCICTVSVLLVRIDYLL